MKLAVIAALSLGAIAAGIVAYLLLVDTGGNSSSATTLIATPTTPTPVATPFPKLWSDALAASHGAQAQLIACRDANHDGLLDGSDAAGLVGLSLTLAPDACAANYGRADILETPPTDAVGYACGAAKPPLLIVAIASAGSTLRDATEGESTGLITVVNALQERATRAGIATQAVVVAPAVFGASPPQTSMEHWVEADLRHRLTAMPCLRAALIGHSHGGVTVTSVAAALDLAYGDRMLGVLIDRTVALYDRNAAEMPAATELLNFYQLNEGWHGVALNLPNVIDVDESTERAPVALSDGGGGAALVSHKTLDDAPGVQQRIEDAILAWAAR